MQHYNTSFLEGNLIRVLKLRGYLFSIIGINDGEKCAQTDVTLNAQHSTTQRLGMQVEMDNFDFGIYFVQLISDQIGIVTGTLVH